MLQRLILGSLGLLLGAVTGAFGATLALRRARGGVTIFGRSRCDHCEKSLGYAQTIPVVSYFVLNGRCASCRATIDRFHLAAEIGGALLLGLILAMRPMPPGALEAVLAAVLWWLVLVDIKTLTLPNILVALAAVPAAILGYLRGDFWIDVYVAAGLALLLSLLATGLKRARGRTMLGAGDVKLVAAMSLWLGPYMSVALLLASLIGLCHIGLRRNAGPVAFGPGLMAGTLVTGLIIMPQFDWRGL